MLHSVSENLRVFSRVFLHVFFYTRVSRVYFSRNLRECCNACGLCCSCKEPIRNIHEKPGHGKSTYVSRATAYNNSLKIQLILIV